MLRELLKHQKDCIDWVTSNSIDHPAIFMEMRLGKTLTTIRLTKDVWQCDSPCLVVAPNTVLMSWEKELFLEGEAYEVMSGKSPKDRFKMVESVFGFDSRVWILISYESLRATPGLVTLDWDVVVLDESTKLKNPRTKISTLCTVGFRDVKHRVILSGLPSPESPFDIYQQFKFLHGSFLGRSNYYSFRKEYGVEINNYGGWDTTSNGRKYIRQATRNKSFILRRNQADMPDVKIREVRHIDMTKDQRKEYKLVEEEFSTWIDAGDYEEKVSTVHVMAATTWASRISGGSDADGKLKWTGKIDELLSLLEGELKNQRIVVWFRFNSEIKHVEDALKKKGIQSRSMHGGVDRSGRTAAKEWFDHPSRSTKVLLCQIKLAKYGIDLSAADTAVYYSMTYSCEEIAQSEDRILHPIKRTPLLYVYLVTKDTIDEDVYAIVGEKITDAKMFMTRLKLRFKGRTNG